VERGIEVQFLLDNSNQHIGGHRAPNLSLDGVLDGGEEEALDAQVLLEASQMSTRNSNRGHP
jgi:hypothetical protein